MFDFEFDEAAVLHALGVENSSPEFKQSVVLKIHATLDKRVGVRLQEMMNEDDITAFNDAVDKSDEEGRAWIQNRFSNYKDIYQEELDQLVAQLKQHSDAVIEGAHDAQLPPEPPKE